MKVITAPEKLPRLTGEPIKNSVFLAGSIEQGKAVDWQSKLIEDPKFQKHIEYVFNPRRKIWDSSWEQSIDNAQFKEQVTWELNAMDMAEIILMYFDPKTKSPISLLELGLYAEKSKLLVCCPEGFWRKGNVDIVCERYEINTISEEEFSDINELLFHIIK